jgi:hypothetical protein
MIKIMYHNIYAISKNRCTGTSFYRIDISIYLERHSRIWKTMETI